MALFRVIIEIMGKAIEVQAKTIDEAVEQGLGQLGVCYDDVEVTVLSQGGMFKKAKVQLTLKKESVEVQPSEKTEASAAKSEPKPTKKQDVCERAVKKDVTIAEGSAPKLDACVSFLEKLLSLMEAEVRVSASVSENAYNIDVSGEDVGRLIGKGGDALNALQTIVQAVGLKFRDDRRRVFVNIENYREKREQTLQDLAKKKAEQAKEKGRSIKLEPMSPRDRAIMHTIIQEIEGVKSYSVGEGKDRRLVIAPKDAE